MAEKSKDKKDDKKKEVKKHSKGGISFEMEVILFLVGIFVVWVLMGKPQTENKDKPFIKGQNITVQK